MLHRVWLLARDTVEGFIEDEAMSRGAAIAYYSVFSVAPLLIIATAMASLAFGEAAVRGALAEQLRGVLGHNGAEAIEALVKGAGNPASGTLAAVFGVVILLATASGVFNEVQSALNAIWRTEPPAGGTVTRILRARLASLLLVLATGLLLLLSLVASTILTAATTWFRDLVPEVVLLLGPANFMLSFALVALLFGAIYKILPDRLLAWRDVAVGALVTAFLFTLGKTLIGWYVGSTSFATTYGAVGTLLVLLLWIYYSAQIFLLGAEFTRAWAGRHGSPAALAALAEPVHGRHHERRQQAATSTGPFLSGAAVMAVLLALFRRRKR